MDVNTHTHTQTHTHIHTHKTYNEVYFSSCLVFFFTTISRRLKNNNFPCQNYYSLFKSHLKELQNHIGKLFLCPLQKLAKAQPTF